MILTCIKVSTVLTRPSYTEDDKPRFSFVTSAARATSLLSSICKPLAETTSRIRERAVSSSLARTKQMILLSFAKRLAHSRCRRCTPSEPVAPVRSCSSAGYWKTESVTHDVGTRARSRSGRDRSKGTITRCQSLHELQGIAARIGTFFEPLLQVIDVITQSE
jgi:hypothetical protein